MQSFWSNLGRPFHYKRSPIHSFNYTSQFLSQSLSNSLSLSILGPAAKEEEIRSSLSPVGKSFSQALSPSLSLCLSLDSTVKGEEEEGK
jgi:hypothetical protein